MNNLEVLKAMHSAYPGFEAEILNLSEFPNLKFGRWIHSTKKTAPTAQELQTAYDTYLNVQTQNEAAEKQAREGRKAAAALALNIPKGQEAVIAQGLSELIQDKSVEAVAVGTIKPGGGNLK